MLAIFSGLKLAASENITISEIRQQPALWPTTLERVGKAKAGWEPLLSRYAVTTGAGTSAYAAAAIAQASGRARVIATTDLLTANREELAQLPREFSNNGLAISLARSGNSPESVGVVERLGHLFPALRHLAITCNGEGRLAHLDGVHAIVLDPRTNDQSLVMTSSFSNLTLAGLLLFHFDQLAGALADCCRRTSEGMGRLERIAEDVASAETSRVVVLGSGALRPLASEAALKILEITGGKVLAMPESYLGLRHGPMSFLREDSLVLGIVSSDPLKRRYEEDLLAELKGKKLGRIVAIAPADFGTDSVSQHVPPMAPELPDFLRTPFEVVFAQLLAYHMSLRMGMNPDQPSPDGVITRVVQSFRIHRDDAEPLQ